jgi:CD109 antigen
MSRQVSRRAFLKATGMTAAAAATGGLAYAAFTDDEEAGRPLAPWVAPTPAPAGRVDEQVQGYVAVAPRILRPGQQESISIALFRAQGAVDVPAASTVTVELLKDGASVTRSSGWVPGRGIVPFDLPALDGGEYTLRVSAKGFRQQAAVRVEDGTLVFIETDKPIYKPGQTVHVRVLALDALLRPAAGEALVEALDAQGIKVFRKTVVVDEYGMGNVDLPLSSEPNLGVWKLQATLGTRKSQVDVRVERYVLPKYEVRVEPRKGWALVDERIEGIIAAEYSFGKPVNGEVEIAASRFVGVWEEYARVSLPIRDGRVAFEVPPVGYATGSPSGGGLASVQLDVTVREQATGYEETTTRLITVASTPTVVRLIAEGTSFKPGLPFTLLVNAETPDQAPLDTSVNVNLTWQNERYEQVRSQRESVRVERGLGLLTVDAPADAVSVYAEASDGNAWTTLMLPAGYSPRGAFIHVQQVERGALRVGDTATFRVAATRSEGNFFYEVVARGKVIFSDVSRGNEIRLTLSPLMAPEARLLVYQIQPDSEVAADYLPISVSGDYPHAVELRLPEEVAPGDELTAEVRTQGAARVGLAAVDRSVFILAENRLNLQQVFAELERLYGQPQVELHEAEEIGFGWSPWSTQHNPGARETFEDAGVIVLTNRTVPQGKDLQREQQEDMFFRAAGAAVPAAAESTSAAASPQEAPPQDGEAGALAEPQRVRQFFPETWVWSQLTTDASGRASQALTAPDSITTWMFRAVALSPEHGLGIGEAEVRVFQPFFAQIDLPYAAIRGEELPAAVALYNYGTQAEEFVVELEPGDWFDVLDAVQQTLTIAPNKVGSVRFGIRPRSLGVHPLRVTARGRTLADALIKELLVEPEGVAREEVENVVLTPGMPFSADLSVPPDAVEGSGRAFLAVTGNVLSQTIEGLEGLLQMPFGCGEQNMILFAPNVFVTRYLQETGQIKPEVLARAELLMLTGYQRQMTYRRADASFSAFGSSDPEGSLWLTAFVLRSFAQGAEIIYIDETVLSSAADWIRSHQNADGSYDPVGFVHHTELLGGVQGRTALTAFVALALHESGDSAGAASAARYLETRLDATEDAYTLAIVTYALALTGSGQARAALDKLMALAKESDAGLHWGDDIVPLTTEQRMSYHPGPQSTAIEATGYATLALLELGEMIDASRAVRWLALQRNAFGGYGSTQDTVVALQAMTAAATVSRSSVDASVAIRAGDVAHDYHIGGDTADILQVVQLPAGTLLTVETRGSGTVMGQVVRRYNLPEPDLVRQPIFELDVDYGTDSVEVDDTIEVSARIRFTPPEPLAAGMIVLDIAVPTGFAPLAETVDALVASEAKLKRWDLAGRKVIFYIEDMLPGESLTLTFSARALYPVRAQPVASQVYAYYRPEWRGESLGGGMTVS